MLWVALILGIFAVVFCIITTVLIALKMLQTSVESSHEFVLAHASTLRTLENIHERNIAQTSSVLDRFMALDFSLFKSYQSAETAEFGGFEEPTEEGGVIAFTPNGAVVRPGADIDQRLAELANEQSLLAEDFGDDFEEREGLR